MLPVLRLIAGGARNVGECLPEIQREFGLSDEEAAELIPSGKQTLIANRVHWARTYLAKAGLLESPQRNVHVVTEKGRELLASNPDHIDNKVLAAFEGFTQWHRSS